MMGKLWVKFAEIYGHQFVRSYGETPSQVWARALARFSGEQIAAGLSRCIEERLEWPPNLPQFVGFCRDSIPTPPDKGFYLPPPVPPSLANETQERREQRLAEIDKKLAAVGLRWRKENNQRGDDNDCA